MVSVNAVPAVGAGLESRQANRSRLYVTAIDPDTTVKVIFSTVRQLENEPITTAAVAETVQPSLTSYLVGQETNMGQAAALGLWETSGSGYQNYDRFIASFKHVAAADIQRVTKKYLQHGRYVVIGDPKKVDRALLTSF